MNDDPDSDAAARQMLVDERARVLRQLEALTRDFDAFVEGAEHVNTDDEHDPEGATIAFERAQVVSLRDEARIRLAALDRALERIDDGSYGACVVCGDPIGAARLEALPGVGTCIRCASAGRTG